MNDYEGYVGAVVFENTGLFINVHKGIDLTDYEPFTPRGDENFVRETITEALKNIKYFVYPTSTKLSIELTIKPIDQFPSDFYVIPATMTRHLRCEDIIPAIRSLRIKKHLS